MTDERVVFFVFGGRRRMSRFRGRQMWRHRVRNYVYRPDRSDRWFAWKKDPPMPDEDPTGALYPDEFPKEPVAGITDDEVEDFLADLKSGGEEGVTWISTTCATHNTIYMIPKCPKCHLDNVEPSAFQKDLADDLKDPEFCREYIRQIALLLRAEAANHVAEPYDDVAIGYIGGLERAADLLDGDR